jgi:hypothetical protein
MIRMKTYKSTYTIFGLALLMSCSDFIQVDTPIDRIVESTVFSNDSYAISAVTGIYSDLSKDGFASGTQTSITMLAGMSADDFEIYTTDADYTQFYNNSLIPGNINVAGLWSSCYATIYSANSVIEGLTSTSGVTPPVKNQLIGEAKFLRAFAHFYLTLMFGAVPIINTTDVNTTRTLQRSSQQDVLLQIERDLVDARDALPDSYSPYGNERIRATKYAAAALLARLYLYKGDWQRAEVESSRVIDKVELYELLDDPTTVFLKNSKEAIWQLVPRTQTTAESNAFVFSGKPILVSLNDDLIATFEHNDIRRTKWIAQTTSNQDVYYYPAKYHAIGTSVNIEYSMVLRVAEQYLIRAEARAKQNKLTSNESAESDINAIRNRAGLSDTDGSTSEDFLAEIEGQRRLEFFAEWGHRWFDLKRTNQASNVLQSIKPFWQSTSILYPLPKYELVNNRSLSQNDGYSN